MDDAPRQLLVERLHRARRETDALFARLSPATLYERPIAQRHRLIFYVGHLEAFDWNLLRQAGVRPTQERLHHRFDELFAFGIDPLGADLPRDSARDWPDLEHVLEYRLHARERIDQCLRGLALAHPGPWPLPEAMRDGACLLEAAIEHRLMHAETLTYLFHRLPLGAFDAQSSEADDGTHGESASGRLDGAPAMASIPAGEVVLGRPPETGSPFGWDNEFAQQTVSVPAFDIDVHMVSNAQYLQFVQDGGYRRPALWLAQDWAWRQAQQIEHPGFWRREGDAWLLRTLAAERPLPQDWPVYVSHAEASAYARWCAKALPSEAQWLRAASGVPLQDGLPTAGNFDARRWDPQSVHTPCNTSSHGVRGLFGNGWEWTRSVFGPHAGFEAFPFYAGYSSNFFDGHHHVLKGGSPRTAACMMRPSFRNWFQAHYQHAYAGFRCVTEGHSCSSPRH